MNVLAAALAVILVVASVFPKTEGVYYIVGDSTGWRVPPSTNFYSTWASGKNFSIGDVLGFNFATGAHDVAVVTKDVHDNCNTANTISLIVAGPANISLVTATDYYFICTFSGHCSGGQKLKIAVSASTNNTTTNTTSPPPPPPPPPSSYASSVGATLLTVVLSIATSTVLF